MCRRHEVSRMINKRTIGILGLVTVAVAILAAACGGDDTTPGQLVRPTVAVPTVERVQPTPTSEPQVIVKPTEVPAEAEAVAEIEAEPVEAEVAVAEPVVERVQPTPTPEPQVIVEPTEVSAEAEAVAEIVAEPVEAEPAAPAVAVEVPTFTWEIEDIDAGIKPAVAVTSAGVPHVAYMAETAVGYVRAAVKNGAKWDITTISEGYFYGPLDLTIGSDDVAHVVYHDHEALQFEPDKGDATYAALRNGTWTAAERVKDAGHDGWDARVTTDAEGNPHISALDPKGFGGNGIEYYRRDSEGKWVVEEVGTGPIDYTFATSIAIGPDGNPHISYYDTENKDLVLASRGASGWTLSPVETAGDTGLFSYLVIGPDGRFHISYFQKTSDTGGTVKYATRGPADSEWEISEVDSLPNLTFGFSGARNVTSLALDSTGRPWIATGDGKLVKLAVWDGVQWQVQTVADAGFRLFGQLVSLALDADDNPHIVFFQVTTKQPLAGRVKYVSGTVG